jgi:hypothetical protein
VNDGELELNAQFKLRFKNNKENIIFIVKINIEARLPYEGFPLFEKSDVFTEQEFNSIVKSIKDEKYYFIEKAKENKTPLISFLEERVLNPQPTNELNSWVTKCPCGGNHSIMIVTIEDEWGCGYCKRKGKLPELKSWLQEISIKEDQKNLSTMMKELKKDGEIQNKRALKWWLNRY